MTDTCRVYIAAVVRDNTLVGPVKVGISTNPWSRVHEMQTGCPQKLAVVHTFKFTSRRAAMDYERSIHESWGYCRIQGEWFDISPGEALRFIVEDIDVALYHGIGDLPLFLHWAREAAGLIKADELLETRCVAL